MSHPDVEEARLPGRAPPRPRGLTLLAATILIWVIGACGGDGGSRKVPPPGPPRATLVLGHASFTGSGVDARGLDPAALSGMHFDGNTLYASDPGNHRVLIFDGIPTSDFEAADRCLGQADLNLSAENAGGISAASMSTPTACYSDGQRLYVCDQGNNRVLVWESPPRTNGAPADHVLGQADFTGNLQNRGGPPGPETLNGPTSVFGDGGSLYVSDGDSHRVLIWDLPISFATEGPPADHVLGQADFVSVSVNRGGAAGADTFYGPFGLFSDGTTLFVTDTWNHRVLFWNVPGAWTDGLAADGVLGQPDFQSAFPNWDDGSLPLCLPEAVSMGRSRRTLERPAAVYAAGGRTFVADMMNNRCLIWGANPPASHACADVVLGQPDATTAIPNNGGVTAAAIWRPGALFADASRLLLYDGGNSRVKIHLTIPAVDNAPADIVYGQPDFTSNRANHREIDASTLSFPSGVAASADRLAIADNRNNRVLIWDPLPVVDGQPADIAIGQPDLLSFVPTLSASGMSRPKGISLSPGDSSLFVVDWAYNRVLVYDAPFATGMAARAALGQPALTTNQAATAANRLRRPSGVSFDGAYLWVADTENNRVLRFSPPFATDMAADLVLGQTSFTSPTPNGGGSGDRSLNGPVDLHSTGTSLLVADMWNHRVLIWNALPQADNDPATAVLGQADFGVPKTPLGGATGLSWPVGVFCDGQSIFVHDGENHRVLRWDAIPQAGTMGPPADGVLGQPDLTETGPNNGGVSASSLDIGVSVPGGAAVTPDGLFLSDPRNDRALRF